MPQLIRSVNKFKNAIEALQNKVKKTAKVRRTEERDTKLEDITKHTTQYDKNNNTPLIWKELKNTLSLKPLLRINELYTDNNNKCASANNEDTLHLQTQYIQNNAHTDKIANIVDSNTLTHILGNYVLMTESDTSHMININIRKRKYAPLTKYIESPRNNVYNVLTQKTYSRRNPYFYMLARRR